MEAEARKQAKTERLERVYGLGFRVCPEFETFFLGQAGAAHGGGGQEGTVGIPEGRWFTILRLGHTEAGGAHGCGGQQGTSQASPQKERGSY